MQGLDVAFAVAKKLTQKRRGKVTFLVPTTEQVVKIVTSAEKCIDSLRDFVKFAKEKEARFPVLKEEPITQDEIDKLVGDLEKMEKMPY